MDVFKLSRNWFDFCFENPEKISPTHTAMYFFIIEHCNRLGWKEKFGLPMEMTKDAIGIKNYKTFSNTFRDLEEWNFITVIQRSKNQYSSNIIALVLDTKANTKALDKAMQKHSQKQVHGIVGIDIQETIKPINEEKEESDEPISSPDSFSENDFDNSKIQEKENNESLTVEIPKTPKRKSSAKKEKPEFPKEPFLSSEVNAKWQTLIGMAPCTLR